MSVKRFLSLCLAGLILALTACAAQPAALTFDDWMSKGERHLLDLNYEQAILAFNEAIKIDPKNPRPWEDKIIAQEMDGDHDGAVQTNSDAQQQVPDFPSIPMDPASPDPAAILPPVLRWFEDHGFIDFLKKLLEALARNWPEVNWPALTQAATTGAATTAAVLPTSITASTASAAAPTAKPTVAQPADNELSWGGWNMIENFPDAKATGSAFVVLRVPKNQSVSLVVACDTAMGAIVVWDGDVWEALRNLQTPAMDQLYEAETYPKGETTFQINNVISTTGAVTIVVTTLSGHPAPITVNGKTPVLISE
ncbi:MAG: tetratricopeptide repeat protein [Oscillospiraceae bacterium]|jgi:hypothetical protein|nr:tetratricopeptide repeat protein [Oscillospiraceae bacterium]